MLREMRSSSLGAKSRKRENRRERSPLVNWSRHEARKRSDVFSYPEMKRPSENTGAVFRCNYR